MARDQCHLQPLVQGDKQSRDAAIRVLPVLRHVSRTARDSAGPGQVEAESRQPWDIIFELGLQQLLAAPSGVGTYYKYVQLRLECFCTQVRHVSLWQAGKGHPVVGDVPPIFSTPQTEA